MVASGGFEFLKIAQLAKCQEQLPQVEQPQGPGALEGLEKVKPNSWWNIYYLEDHPS